MSDEHKAKYFIPTMEGVSLHSFLVNVYLIVFFSSYEGPIAAREQCPYIHAIMTKTVVANPFDTVYC